MAAVSLQFLASAIIFHSLLQLKSVFVPQNVGDRHISVYRSCLSATSGIRHIFIPTVFQQSLSTMLADRHINHCTAPVSLTFSGIRHNSINTSLFCLSLGRPPFLCTSAVSLLISGTRHNLHPILQQCFLRTTPPDPHILIYFSLNACLHINHALYHPQSHHAKDISQDRH